jgi:prolyl-tRNA synthetase
MPMFKIEFEVKPGEKAFAWQNSWGFSTRSLGVITMVHGDDKGLILPPRIAPIQVVIVPIVKTETDMKALMEYVKSVESSLKKSNIRVHVDDREQYKPGWKFNHWELKGVPIRLDIGSQDVEKKCVMTCRRDNQEKVSISFEELEKGITNILDDIHKCLFEKAKKKRDEHRVVITKWEDFVPALDKKNCCLVPFCNEIACEENIKKKSKIESEKKQKEKKLTETEDENSSLSGSGKSLCIPFEETGLQKEIKDEVCFCCGEKAKVWCLFGRSY